MENFKWTDELVKEYAEQRNPDMRYFKFLKSTGWWDNTPNKWWSVMDDFSIEVFYGAEILTRPGILQSFTSERAALDYVKDNKPKRKPLFTTEDGMVIFKYDNLGWYEVDTFTFKIFFNTFYSTSDQYKRFFMEQSAKDYVMQNKPVLSLKDIENICNYSASSHTANMMKLQALVKSRL